MKLRPTFFIAAATTAIAIVACSDSNDTALPGELPDSGGGTTMPEAGASADAEADPVDAAADAADATKGDAGVRECSDDGFCHTVLPPGETLRGVWGDGQGIVWAVSETGRILRWDGNAWSIHTSTPDNAFYAIWGSGPTDIWVSGATGLMHGTGDSSAAIVFSVVDAPGDSTLTLKSIWGTGPNDVWAVGGDQNLNGPSPWPARGRVVHYTGPDPDGGSGWTLDNEDPVAFRTVWGTPNSGVWMQGAVEASAANGGSIKTIIRRRAPGASGWVEVPMPPGSTNSGGPHPREIFAAAATSDTSMWLVGRTQGFVRAYYHGTSTDNGQTYSWTLIERVAWDLEVNAFWGTANSEWSVGEHGRIRRWDGAKWQQPAIMVSHVPVTAPFYAAWGTSGDDFWAVGKGIAVHKTPGKP